MTLTVIVHKKNKNYFHEYTIFRLFHDINGYCTQEK